MYRFMHGDYPDDVCEVVQQGYYHHWRPDLPVKHMCQFSWFCDGKSDKPLNTKAFEESIMIAKEVLHDSEYIPNVEYALFYHADSVNPYWASKLEFVDKIGNHSFYK
jgi:spore germination cell wall hydrolase CwlJ-like protein